MIEAKIYTEEQNAITFNVTAWFEQAADDDIIEVVDEDFKGRPAIEIAEWIEENENEEDLMLFFENTSYLAKSKNNYKKYKCEIDDTSAMEWIEENRPDLYEVIMEAQAKGSW